MAEFNIMKLLESAILTIEEFQPDLSNSPLRDDEKLCLADKIKNMQCEAKRYTGSMKFIFPLERADFAHVHLANKIYLSDIRGNTLTEFVKNIETDSEKWERNIIVNIILKEDSEMREMLELFDKMDGSQNSSKFTWGMAIDENASDKYCLEVLSYN